MLSDASSVPSRHQFSLRLPQLLPMPKPKTRAPSKPIPAASAASAPEPATKVPRTLDIEAQFRRHATSLVNAAEDGKETHHTANIAESGGPLEATVMKLFAQALPSTFDTFSGYFFDTRLELSAQCDLLLCDESEILRLPPSDKLTQKYVPYNCVRVIGQIKNSFSGLKNALEQASVAISAWRSMRAAEEFSSAEVVPQEPLAVVVIGLGGTEAELRAILEAGPKPRPAYVLLVESGLLYGPDSNLRHFTDLDEAVFRNQRNGVPLCLMESKGQPKNDAGRLLMWLFFALLAHASARRTSAFDSLLKTAEREFPVTFGSLPAI